MKRRFFDGICCYLSSMLLFNLIYGLTILGSLIKHSETAKCSVYLTLLFVIVFVIIGFFSSFLLLCINDCEQDSPTSGRKFVVSSVKDSTAENYLTSFSVIVLTSLNLSTQPDWIDFSIYLLFEIVIGIVYIKKKLFYMNPILTLFDYSVYDCVGCLSINNKKFENEACVFITKHQEIMQKDTIRYKNINSRIIWIKKGYKCLKTTEN